eukprot:CAMPEP_0176443430 /NCGR_PEP_ID=MMETSP0127-20121128/22416_1 /TAXON_ID=938130 /ORGANISM="Platyophrya macrostoma, Strain WH" /LENGTH=606 /DNA_ID=CAMNT_0017828653 /DNA_START=28 /DNA_END=1844 /DNA_ORIENTATION=+
MSSSSAKKAVKRSRSMRQVEAYATYDGQRPLKSRGIEEFAPAAAAQREGRRRVTGPSKAEEEAPQGSTSSLPPAVTEWLKARRNAVPSSAQKDQVTATAAVAKSTIRAAVALSSVPAGAPGRFAASIRRAVVTAAPHVTSDIVALSAAHIATQQTPAAGAVVVVVLPADKDVDVEAARLRSHYGIAADLVTVTAASHAASTSVVLPVVSPSAATSGVTVVLVSLEFMSAAASSLDSLAKVMTHMMISTLSPPNVAAAAKALKSGLDVLAASRKVVAAASIPILVIGDSVKAISEPFGVATYDALESATNDTTAATSSSPAAAVTVSCISAEGPLRFQALYGLIHAQAHARIQAAASAPVVTTLITVHFATPETCLFWYDVLLALQELPEEMCSIVCDTEGSRAERKEVMSHDEARTSAINRVIAAARRSTTSKVVVLLSSYATVVSASELPPTVTRRIFVQYDAPLSVASFPEFIAEKVHRTAATHHVVLFIRRNELQSGILGVLGTAAKSTLVGRGVSVRFEQAPVPSATLALLSFQRMKGLHKKLFAVAQRAFEAYRASMHVYSRLRPLDVFNVKDLDLTAYAGEFGFEDAPLLDLRTKATAFR